MDGTVACWGDDFQGQCRPPQGTFTQLTLGARHTCGIRTDGGITCWGAESAATPRVPDGRFIQITATGFSTCGLRADHTVECFGKSQFEEEFLKSPPDKFEKLMPSATSLCGKRVSGEWVCFGDGPWREKRLPQDVTAFVAGYQGDAFAIDKGGCISALGDIGRWPAAPEDEVSSIAVGLDHVCALRPEGTIICWGKDYFMQTLVPGGRYSDVALTLSNSCALDTNGFPRCWHDADKIESIAFDAPVTQMVIGPDHYCGLHDDQSITCQGGESTPRAPVHGRFLQLSAGTSSPAASIPHTSWCVGVICLMKRRSQSKVSMFKWKVVGPTLAASRKAAR